MNTSRLDSRLGAMAPMATSKNRAFRVGSPRFDSQLTTPKNKNKT